MSTVPGSVPPAPADLLFQDAGKIDEALSLSLDRYGRIGVRGRWFINSHPKSGTHLLRNILLHFNTPEIYRDILFYDSIGPALDKPDPDQIYMGHIPYPIFAGHPSRPMRTVLLLRHPGAIALALARAFYDRNSTRPDHLYMREHDSFETIVCKVVTGYECKGQEFGSLASSLSEFCLDWLGEVDFVMRFETITLMLRLRDAALLTYFAPSLGAMFESVPNDAAQRIRAGASAAISATYSRTAASAYDALRPDDVYRLLPSAEAQRLQSITGRLGY
jgi:hypothetical protein